MTRIHSGLSRILASIGRTLSGGAAAPDVPPIGWERRLMHLPNGDLLSVELPISPAIEAGRFGGSLPAAPPPAGRPEGPMPKPTAHASDALGRPTSPLRQPRPDRARPIRNDCPLLVEFLERRAGR